MNDAACDFYQMKPDVLPPRAKPIGLSVRRGRMPAYVKPWEWELAQLAQFRVKSASRFVAATESDQWVVVLKWAELACSGD